MIAQEEKSIQSYDAVSGEPLPGEFRCLNPQEIGQVCKRTAQAFHEYKAKTGEEKALFLEAIADEILNLGNALIQRAMAESGLPEARLVGERGRTMNQLRLFASLLREGSWVEASIDLAQSERAPLAKPDIRKMLQPVGPVVVFTASNFPLAFSTAGGDTASALAAGNPVIVKAHESHLGTNDLVAKAIQLAAEKTGMPAHVFSSVVGEGFETGKLLTQNENVKSVVFTGSQKGGEALLKYASERKNPIPVFAEMGSVNPVVLLPQRLEEETDSWATKLAGSLTLGVGQFCTQPGLIFGLKLDAWTAFANKLSSELANGSGATMLNKGIQNNYANKIGELQKENSLHWRVSLKEGSGMPALVEVTGQEFIGNSQLHHEVFGPFSILVTCESVDEILSCLKEIEGQLTTTIIGTDQDLKRNVNLIKTVENIAGRLVFNGVPTGVEVCHSMHHGGSFPASTDNRFTSVGTDAIKRFARPVCYQDCPDGLLPEELRNENPLNIWRKTDGQMGKE